MARRTLPGPDLSRRLTDKRLRELVKGFRRVRVAVVGDFFLDRYWVVDPALAERSLETGLEARQVVARRSSPGHAGTVTNNLRALGVETIYAAGVTGDDGEGYELRHRLVESGVDVSHLVSWPDVVTGTYVKPMARQPDGTERELERLDIRQRAPMPRAAENALLARLQALTNESASAVDAVIVADQVEERNYGAITDRVREAICLYAAGFPGLVWYADSRRRSGEYRNLILKPNREECLRATADVGERRPTNDEGLGSGGDHPFVVRRSSFVDEANELHRRAQLFAARSGRTAFVTMGADGMLVVTREGSVTHVPGIRVEGPVDPTGAGDSATAGIVPALALGASAPEAAALGTLVASIAVRQLGTTGTATPEQVLEVNARLATTE